MQLPDVWVEMCHSLHFIVVATDRVRVAGGGPQRGQVHHVAAVPPLAVEVVAVLQEVDVEVNWKVQDFSSLSLSLFSSLLSLSL